MLLLILFRVSFKVRKQTSKVEKITSNLYRNSNSSHQDSASRLDRAYPKQINFKLVGDAL